MRSQSGTDKAWASLGECARRLGWSDWTSQSALAEIAGRLNDPPFTQQSDHAAQIARIGAELNSLPPVPTLVPDGEARCRAALTFTPDDPALLMRLAALLDAGGKWEEATEAAQRVVELLPHHVDAWMQLGVALVHQNRNEEAVQAFESCLARDPQNVFARVNLAQVLVRWIAGRKRSASTERAIALSLLRLGPSGPGAASGRGGSVLRRRNIMRRHDGTGESSGDLAILARSARRKAG